MFISDSSLGLFCNMVMDEKGKKFPTWFIYSITFEMNNLIF